MKKLLALILALVMALSLVACSGSKTEKPAAASGEPTKMTIALRAGAYGDVRPSDWVPR